MGSFEQHMGNATSVTLLHQLRDLQKSSRGTVVRIEALSIVAIVLSFVPAAFGSCRRWSDRWIVQKGFLAAHILSLSLGTYSIGLMQSSPVKSEMYPIWSVSLLTLLGCIDPVTAYNGLDYKGPLLKTIFQLCLYCGYVLLMSISTMSNYAGNNIAIGALCAITFMKGFHRSLALVLPSRMRDVIVSAGIDKGDDPYAFPEGDNANQYMNLTVNLPVDLDSNNKKIAFGEKMKAIFNATCNMKLIWQICSDKEGELGVDVSACEDVCLAYSLSHSLQGRFLRFGTYETMQNRGYVFGHLVRSGCNMGYKRALKVIEVELAFLYEVLFTSNPFIHFYQAKAATFWALASFTGTCFVGVAATIRGLRHDTRTADLVITLVIFVSLALLQLVQLIQCWTSNWARVAFACEYAMSRKQEVSRPRSWWRWMRLKALVVTRMNWFEGYLWKGKLGQHSLVDEASSRRGHKQWWRWFIFGSGGGASSSWIGRFYGSCTHLLRMFGLHYIGQVLRELLASGSDSTGASIRLHDDVKEAIADFLRLVKSKRIGLAWSLVTRIFPARFHMSEYPPYAPRSKGPHESTAHIFAHHAMACHIATCYCELADQSSKPEESAGCKQEEAGGEAEQSGNGRSRARRVAITLSKYYAYLAVSKPELLPGPPPELKSVYENVAWQARELLGGAEDKLKAMENYDYGQDEDDEVLRHNTFLLGLQLGKWLLNDSTPNRWELLERLWVHIFLYAAPSGDADVHLLHLSQGGEFITHLWALLHHIGIDQWESDDAVLIQE